MGRSIIEQVEEEKAQRLRDEERRSELRGRMRSWKDRGYVVARLIKAIDGDMASAERTFSDFERDVRRLSELQLRLDRLDILGFPDEVLAIRQRLNDPDAADGLEHGLADLEGKIGAKKEEERKRAAESSRLEKEKRMGMYRQRIAAWAEKGYSTKRLDGLLEDPALDTIGIEKRLAEFDSGIQNLLELGRRLEAVRPAGGEEELRELDRMLLDPDAAAQAEAKVAELERRLFQKRSDGEKRQLLGRRLAEYKEKGYKVGRLEGAPDGPLDRAEELFRSYEADVGALFKLWDRLRALNRANFPTEWEAARGMMNDPDRVAEVEAAVKALEAKQAASERTRAQDAQRLAKEGKELVHEVFEKMQKTVPDYLPLGFYVKDGRWEPQLSADGTAVRAEMHPGLFGKETAVVACELSAGISPGQLANEAEKSRAASRYVAKCLLLAAPAPPEMAAMVKAFVHPNYSVYIYDLSAGALIYNPSDLKTEVYSSWFARGQAPQGMRKAIGLVADRHGIFNRAALEQRLGLSKREIDEMLNGWLAANAVIQVSKIREEYSFMD